MKISMPRFIVFDLDHTLYNSDLANDVARDKLIEYLCLETSIKKDKIEAAYDVSRQKVKERLGNTASSHSRILYVSQTIRELEIKTKPSLLLMAEQIYWSNYMSQMIPRQGLLEFLQLARLHKISILLVTDLTLQIQLQKLLRLRLDDTFDFVFASEELGGDKKTGKPMEAIKQIIKEDITWFFGDLFTDFLIEKPENTFFHMDSKSLLLDRNVIAVSDFNKPFELLNKVI